MGSHKQHYRNGARDLASTDPTAGLTSYQDLFAAEVQQESASDAHDFRTCEACAAKRDGARFPGGGVIATGATPPVPAFTYGDLAQYLARYGRTPAANSPSTEVGRTREAHIGPDIEIHVHGGQVPANGGHPSEIHVVSTATGQTEKLAVLGPDQAHALPGEEFGHAYVQFGAWLGRPTRDPSDVRTAVLRDNGVTGEVQPS